MNRKLCQLAGIAAILLISPGCRESDKPAKLFALLSADRTNIHFENRLSYTRDFNILNYRNFYNGGGVGIGDINNDGLQDIYLTANTEANKLYLNRGDFEFEEVTEQAGVAGTRGWSTGVSMADINADGRIDIYVCNSGNIEGDDRKNELFINNGDGTFTEQAEAYGLADTGYSIHAAFFDYDRDGDLDTYLLNNHYIPTREVSEMQGRRPVRDEDGGDRLMRNDEGKFTDVSEEAGIYGSIIGRGLGVSVSDLDRDGWPDLYISNDFFERDYIYMNNRDGTFREVFEKQVRSSSAASMGADIADLNGDGYPEIFVTEMLPETNERLNTNMSFVTWNEYQFYLENGYYHQFTRNVLQHHKGIIPNKGVAFSEIGRMAGVEATDWSWAANIMDLDNDGFKDLFVANGIYHDILDKDYTDYVANPRREFFMKEGNKMVVNLEKMINNMPSNRISNYAYAGGPQLTFTKKTAPWGLDKPSFSNGSAYGDLDNDGHLDLVINNVNMPAFVYRNRGGEMYPRNSYLKVELEGRQKNTGAIGARVTLKAGGKKFYLEQIPNRGFQSSVDSRLNFGLGEIRVIDTVLVDWPCGGKTLLTDLPVNQTLTLEEPAAAEGKPVQGRKQKEPFFHNISDGFPLSYRHEENEFNDFDKNPLLFHMKSTEGPKAAAGDVNGDGLQDLFLGGARGSPGELLVQDRSGGYSSIGRAVFETDKESEDLGALFFDADGDGDPDLYVTSGGNEALAGSDSFSDRLYFNDGKGGFTKSPQELPAGRSESSSVVRAADADGDGDMDLFVGVRLRPGLPGIPQHGYLLQNNGEGTFRNVTRETAPGLLNAGMITDAVWSDYDSDGDADLLVVGRWMNIRLFENDGTGTFSEQTEQAGLATTAGWWNTVEAADIDGDGDTDFVAGNLGLNSRFRASREKPMRWYINDFDRNGSIEQIICAYQGDRSYPLISRDQLVGQLLYLEPRYPTNASYAGQTINDIFTEKEMDGTTVLEMTLLESVLLRNRGDGTFKIEPLPRAAQVSPVFAILVRDLDDDGNQDLLFGGNLHGVKPEIGIYDASYGTYLKGTDNGGFRTVPSGDSGLALDGEIRDFVAIDHPAGRRNILVLRNDDTPVVLELQRHHHRSR